jgi:hypothetical protein
VATKNCISLFCIDGLIRSIRYQISSGTNKLIEFVTKNLINSLKPPSYIDNLKITFLDKKYETITPIENTPIFVR